ncbi:TonB-dependent receptor domain-containing protein [Spirosoma pulveris]
MKTAYAFLLTMLLASPILAQKTVQGSLVDKNNKPLAFASIALLNASDSSLISGSVASAEGHYQFEQVKPGQYRISVSMVGFQPTKSDVITVADSPVTVPALTLNETSQQLKEVAVSAQKPFFEQQIDRMVINVQSSLMAAGSTALDILERSPGVTVDRNNNVLAMNGKQGVMVMLNGKLSRIPLASLLPMLGGMNAGNIEKIELITTPPAQYDAEGNAGLINIVTKRNANLGTNGSWTTNVGYGRWERAGLSGNVNRKTEKLSLFADYSGQMNHLIRLYKTSRTLTQPVPTYTAGSIRRDERDWLHNGQAGLEWSLSPRTTISSLATFQNFLSDQIADNATQTTRSGLPLTQVNVRDNELNNTWVYTGNVNLRHTPDKGTISADLDYIHFFNNNPHRYQFDTNYEQEGRQEQESVRNEKRTPIQLWVAKLDYSRNLTKTVKLETGAKSTFAHFDNNVEFETYRDNNWQVDSTLSQHVQMNETIWAGYVNVSGQLTAKNRIQAGLRYEHTRTDLRTIDGPALVYRNYGNWFPTVFWTHTLNPSSSIQVSYSQRIGRPSFNQLAPFLTYIDPSAVLGGNEQLLPALAKNIQASYRFRKNFLLTLDYTRTTNPIAFNLTVIPAENRQVTRPENLDLTTNVSLTFSFPLVLTPWWQMQTSLLGYRQATVFTQEGNTRQQHQLVGRLTHSQTFTFPHNFAAELSGFYQSRALIGVMVRRPFGVLNVAVKKQLPGNKGSLRLAGEDLLWSSFLAYDLSNPAEGYSATFGGRGQPHAAGAADLHAFIR